MKINWTVSGILDQDIAMAVRTAIARATDRAMHDAVRRVVYWGVHQALYDAVDEAMYQTGRGEPLHPSLPDFLARTGTEAP